MIQKFVLKFKFAACCKKFICHLLQSLVLTLIYEQKNKSALENKYKLNGNETYATQN